MFIGSEQINLDQKLESETSEKAVASNVKPAAAASVVVSDVKIAVKKEQIVDPWTVESDETIDYDKLIQQFGSQRLTIDLVERIEKLTGKKYFSS